MTTDSIWAIFQCENNNNGACCTYVEYSSFDGTSKMAVLGTAVAR